MNGLKHGFFVRLLVIDHSVIYHSWYQSNTPMGKVYILLLRYQNKVGNSSLFRSVYPLKIILLNFKSSNLWKTSKKKEFYSIILCLITSRTSDHKSKCSKMELSAKIVDGFQTLSIFAKRSVFNALQGSKTPLKLKNGFSLSFVSFTNWIRKSKNKYSKMDLFEKKVNVWKPLSIFSKSSILEHLPLYSRIQFVNRQKMTWRNPFF